MTSLYSLWLQTRDNPPTSACTGLLSHLLNSKSPYFNRKYWLPGPWALPNIHVYPRLPTKWLRNQSAGKTGVKLLNKTGPLVYGVLWCPPWLPHPRLSHRVKWARVSLLQTGSIRRKLNVQLSFVDISDDLKNTLWGKIFLPSSQCWKETLVFTNTEINVRRLPDLRRIYAAL